jgi:hypothetical protein
VPTVGTGQTIPPAMYLPIVRKPAPTSTPTVAPTIAPTPTATPFPLLFVCSHDYYNCDDFGTWQAAQEVFEYCAVWGPVEDIHGLDQDNDDIACESLPGFP